jgi:copper chaperone CopZ
MTRTPATGSIAEVEFSVPSMMCDGCAGKIRHALTAVPGVQQVKAKLWRKRVRVRYEPSTIGVEQLKDALVAAGFPAVEP